MQVSEVKALVDRINPLSDTILELCLTPERYIDYQPGQYLQIKAGDYLSYSIANAPLGAHKYELHIRHEGGNPYDQPLFAQIKREGAVSLRVPLGECSLPCLKKSKPIIFIAGGTGFAPIKAMIEYLLATGDPRPFVLYWGARRQSDLYMDERVQLWQKNSQNFRYHSVVSAQGGPSLLSLVLEHKLKLTEYEIVIAGPFDMVYALRDQLLALGVNRQQLYSDAFSFESLEGK